MIRRNGKLTMGGALALILALGACSGDSEQILGPGSITLEREVVEPPQEPVREQEPEIPDGCIPTERVQSLAGVPEPC